jgi:predicted DNA-binding transcriptional regulator AlpA
VGRDFCSLRISRVEIGLIPVKNDDSEYISLKEAAALSGYSADYVGQLIRQGKLPGKQIFSNVAWVTTEAAVREYMDQKTKPPTERSSFKNFRDRLTSPDELARLTRVVLWMSIIGTSVVVLFLAFLVAVSIDKRLEQQSMETAYAP